MCVLWFRDRAALAGAFSLSAAGRVVMEPDMELDVPYGAYAVLNPTETVCLGPGSKPIWEKHRIHRHPPTGVCEPSDGAYCVGPVARMSYVARRCCCNVLNALRMRHGVQPPAVSRQWIFAVEWVSEFLRVAPWKSDPIDRDDYVAWLKHWPAAKSLQIESSVTRDVVQPSRLQAMLKREGGHSYPTKARLIQFYPNMATQARFASTFVCVQKALTRWAPTYVYRGVRVTLGSGLNSGGLGAWMDDVISRFDSPWFYERDGKNWDATMQRFHHDFKMRVYRAVDRDFAEFVDQGFKCRSRVFLPEGVVDYTINGTVKSGHNDTTLGNSLINAAIAVEACVALGLRAEIIVVGDDCLVACDRNPSGMAEIERGFGIVPEARIFRDYLDVTFISGLWLAGEGGMIFLPKLGRLLARLWWTCLKPSKRHLPAYKRGVSLGLLSSCRGIPLYSDFIRCEESGPVLMSRDTAMWLSSFGGGRCSAATKVDLLRRYDLSETEFVDLQVYLRSLPSDPVYIRHALVERVLDVDLADCLDRPLAT